MRPQDRPDLRSQRVLGVRNQQTVGEAFDLHMAVEFASSAADEVNSSREGGFLPS